ncbi:3-isopropylmalate dehydratase small subunit [Bacillota bacterium Meth-B3]|nr:3-isopropylmalate dehydratase small subunit [Christensenellaceae bacterium]MEA5065474.1 3-isopropylmalate dehydratase small subunit [Eubacteriales bacterium]MEA5069824.1 3-isopropylmalate dehydratase small subunit [Christensenellaceae bacterium]
MKIEAQAIRYGDNIDTDVIIPARYLNTADPKELAAHCMEDLDPDFLNKLPENGILVGGTNFGCGSSREHAPLAIKYAHVSCVVAKSFARIFYRNAVNIGLPIVVCDAAIETGDRLSIDLERGVLQNLTTGEQAVFPAFPAFLTKIIDAGGLMNAMKEGSL